MKGVTFQGQTSELKKPSSMTNEECYSLPIRRTNWNSWEAVESVWELTDEEIERLKESKRIVFSAVGFTHPPISMSVVQKGGIYDAPQKEEKEMGPSFGKMVNEASVLNQASFNSKAF